MPPRSLTSLTVVSVVITSPAHTCSPQTNSCEPWTIIGKLMPTSGSSTAGPTEPAE